ncbi:protein kinase [Pseudoduganella sp. GCM10020061]|uniref:protein kinase domain-containing protein n=1 Tax=Pseudoduganella sp. GCM10020061 TaxID=3317345 RepID=UPI00363A9CCE
MQAGDTIRLQRGQYELRERLAGSSYGVAWRARGPGHEAVLKLVNREQMQQARPEQRAHWVGTARTEIAFLRSLSPWDGRHIVRLLDSGEHEGLPVAALERLDCDLARHMDDLRGRGEKPSFAQALDWLGQVNQALARVHQYGWRHLDLKPGNLLLDASRSSIRLADFGTNRLLSERDPHPYAGTANWQAPEQYFPAAGDGFHTDARTDYFAMGALFFYLVTGGAALRFCTECGDAYRAHRGDGPAAVLARHGGALPPTLHEDEAARFAGEAARGNAGAGDHALALLRALTHADRAQRPRHALDISRMIAAARAADRADAHAAPRWRM